MVVGFVTSSAGTGVNIVDLTNVPGLTTIALTDGAGTADLITVNKLNGTTVVNLGTATDEFKGTATLNLATVTGTADALTVKLVDTDSTGTADTIAADGIESLTLEVIGDGTGTSGEDHKIAITNTNANAITLNVVGTDDDTTLTLSAVASGITTINVATYASALSVDTGAIGTAVMTITGGTGNDTIGMKNTASVLDGGTKTSDNDTLNISFSGTGGALIVDLSSSTDQVQMFNGLANAAVQKNFESVNASAYTQTNSVGADITGSTGANTLVGTAYADTIRTNGGGDTVTGDAGADAITLGTGVDTVILSDSSYAADSITGFSISGGDVLKFIDASALSLLGTSTLVYAEGTQADGTADLDDVIAGGGTPLTAVNVIVITDAVSTFTAGGIDSAVDTAIGGTSAGNGGVIVIAAASSGDAEIWFDADGDTAAGTPGANTYKLATLVGVSVADLVSFAAANFLIG